MCGFTGFYTNKVRHTRLEYEKIAREMANTLNTRGPDFGDVWHDPHTTLLLGHRRLSILDLSEHGHQPMTAERYVIAFNGEIYNHLSLRKSYLEGYSFKGHSDTETLLALFDALGFEKTLSVISGMFAFALWDRKEQVLHFARDRLGKKPLYVGWAGQNLIFGSELKALRAHPDFTAEIDRRSLSLYSQHNCVPAPHSIYKHIWQLIPGCSMSLPVSTIKSGADLQAKMVSYWHAAEVATDAKPLAVSDEAAVDQFEKVLMTCVEERMLADVPLGAFLSGGIDSSAIVALMSKISDKPVHSYTIGFDVPGFDEASHAREIAQHLGIKHHDKTCTPADALAVVEKLPYIYDEPFADQSAIPTYLVSEFARQDVTVALSGDGGDEMLGGYSRHFMAPKIIKLPSIGIKFLASLPPSLLRTLFPHKPLLKKHLQIALKICSASDRMSLYKAILSNWDIAPVLEHSNTPLHLTDYSKLGLSEQLMLWDTQHYLPNLILTKVDRASMAVSLEARAPLLDHKVFEFVWRLPLSMKIRDGQGKWLLREVLARHVPRAMFERPKQGFNVPIGQWLRSELRDWAEDLLDESRLKNEGYFDATRTRNAWNEHIKGHGHHDERLWNILMFQAWHRAWMG